MFRSTKDLRRASRDAALHPTDIVDVNGAARVLGLSVSTLNKLRAFRPTESPRFLKCGRRVLYRLGDLHEWQEQRLTGGAPTGLNEKTRVMAPHRDQE